MRSLLRLTCLSRFPTAGVRAAVIPWQLINYASLSPLGERRGSLSLAAGDASLPATHANPRARRMSTSKVVDNRPRHLVLGDFELTNVV